MKHYSFFFFFLFFGSVFVGSAQEPVGEDSSEIQNISEQESIDSFKLNKAVRMYPNPVQHYLTIQSSLPITRVQVFTLLGQLVKEVSSNYTRIYLGELNSGIYMIKIYSNEYHVTKKLVKR